MKKSIRVSKNKKILSNNRTFQSLFLFGLIGFTCLFFDFYYQNNILFVPFIITTLISLGITFIGIPKLKKIKIEQIIRNEGPKKHFLKQGTPTMGGIFIIPTAIIVVNILSFNKDDYNIILILSFLIISFMIIGFLDDLLSLKKQINTGLTSNQKLILQLIISIIFILICKSNNYINENLYIGNNLFNFSYFIYPLGVFVLLAESNSSNLTDGLDGLLSGCSVLIFTGLAIDILIENQGINQSITQLSIVMAGSCMGFVFLNKNPAKIFMGDSGSLAIGASLAGIALISNNLFSLLIVGGILAAESISVIMQVTVFKISKRLKGKGHRLFLMTPIHHHFELSGNNENSIVSSFWIITLLLVITNLIIF